jgi:hypothetical protein
MSRYRTYAVPVGVSDTARVLAAQHYADSVGNRPERAEWNARIVALFVRDSRDRAAAMLARYRRAVARGSVGEVADIVAFVTGSGGSVQRPWSATAWAYASTRWRGLLDAANHVGTLEYRSAFAEGVLNLDPSTSTGPGDRWAEVYALGHSRSTCWAEYDAALERLERRAADAYRALGVPSCWRCGACGPVRGNGYCESCADVMVDCDGCGTELDRVEAVECSGWWCDDCASDNLTRCDDCGTFSDPEGEPSCRCVTSVVNGYGYKPSPLFHLMAGSEVVSSWHAPTLAASPGRHDLVMGVEVEVESDGGAWSSGLRDLAAAGWIADGFAYLKSDGSLCDGVEIVTHPATLDAWRDLVKGFADIGNGLKDHGWAATESCGIHVHVNRSAFASVAHRARHGVLWHSWRDGLVPVCGRGSSTYAAWSPEGRAAVVGHATGDRHCPRYSPINYQPDATVEVRCFASTLDVDVLAGLLDVVAASVAFSEVVTSADILAGRAAWESFVLFIESAGYPAANALVLARGGK